MYYHNYERHFLIFRKVEYSAYNILRTYIFSLNLNLDYRNFQGRYFWGGPLLLEITRRVPKLTLFSGRCYFWGAVTFGILWQYMYMYQFLWHSQKLVKSLMHFICLGGVLVKRSVVRWEEHQCWVRDLSAGVCLTSLNFCRIQDSDIWLLIQHWMK